MKNVAGSDSSRIQAPACSRADDLPSMRSAAKFCTTDSAAATSEPAITSSAPCTIISRSALATYVPSTRPVMAGTSRPMQATSVPRLSRVHRSLRFLARPKRSSPPTPVTAAWQRLVQHVRVPGQRAGDRRGDRGDALLPGAAMT